MVGSLGIPLSLSLHPLCPATHLELSEGLSVVHYLTLSVTGDHLTSIQYVIYNAFSGPESPLSLLTALSGRLHIPCLIGS